MFRRRSANAEFALKPDSQLPPCTTGPIRRHALALGDIPLGLHTDLVQLRLSLASESCGWLQRVSVAPPIAPERDRAAIARFLGPRGFFAWMRAMLVGDIEAPDTGSVGGAQRRSAWVGSYSTRARYVNA